MEKYIKQDIQLLYKNYEKNIFYPKFSNALQKKNKNFIIFERYKNIILPEKSSFIFHSSYYRYCKNKNAINIITVYDFVYEYYRHDLKSIFHKNQKKNAIYNSNGIIFISESTKNDFEKLFPDYKGEKRVIYLGFSSEYKRLSIPKKNNIIFIGSRTGYKNFEYVVKIVKELPDFKLQIISGGKLKKREIMLLRENIPNKYEHYSVLTNNELNNMYNEAKFLIYPSLYEGFGVPVIEAQAAGCPVVCCNVSSLPEVAGDAGIYISGKNINEDLEKIKQLKDQEYYDNIIEKGLLNCKKFSWEKCASETYNFYDKVYDLRKNNENDNNYSLL
jgi:mannosyltransferase